jgi:hypothetical protein
VIVRIAGWLLLIVGAVLCISIAWAALGFLLMGVGLIALQVAEQNRKRRTNIPAAIVEANPAPVARSADRSAPADLPPYDKAEWLWLLEQNPDLSRLNSILAPYGQKYTDQLAIRYLAVLNNDHLPAIVENIIREARRDADLNAAHDRRPPALQSAPRSKKPSYPVRDQFAPAKPPAKAVTPQPKAILLDRAEKRSSHQLSDAVEGATADRNATITSADDELSEMMDRFAPDPAFSRKES